MKFNFFKNMSKKVVNVIKPKTKDAENVGNAFSDIAKEVISGNCTTLIELAKKLKEDNIIKQYYLKNTNNSAKKFSIAGVSVTAFINMILNKKVVVGTNDRLSWDDYCKLCSAFLVKPFEVSVKKGIVKSGAMVKAFKDADSGKKNLGEQLSKLVHEYYKVEPEVQSTDVKIDTSAEEKMEKNNEADDTKSIESVMEKGRATWVSSVFTHKAACDGVVKLLNAIYNKWVKDVPVVGKYYTTDDIPAKSKEENSKLKRRISLSNITNLGQNGGFKLKDKLDSDLKKVSKFSPKNVKSQSIKSAEKNEEVLFDKSLCDETLTEVTIPDGVTYIKDNGFANCEKLTRITIPNSVTTIGERAFSFCDNLTSITIPDSVTIIGNEAFMTCGKLESVTISNSVTTIGKGTFGYCGSLASITIPDSVTTIGDGAFQMCGKLKSVTIPNSVTTIGNGTFVFCGSLTSITIPDSVTTIGNGAFQTCGNLESVTISNSVTAIGNRVFNRCGSLTSITIPNSVTTIGKGAFGFCSSLTSITIPSNVTTIGKGAFEFCSSLTSITIPDSVKIIGDGAFNQCYSLVSIKYNGNEYSSVDNFLTAFNKIKK